MSTENTLPERFLPLLHEIASNLESGLVSYVNYETLEVELIPADFVDDLDEYKSICGDDIEIQHLNWDSYFWITPLLPHESFRVAKFCKQRCLKMLRL